VQTKSKEEADQTVYYFHKVKTTVAEKAESFEHA
jgi:hypothetical protein